MGLILLIALGYYLFLRVTGRIKYRIDKVARIIILICGGCFILALNGVEPFFSVLKYFVE